MKKIILLFLLLGVFTSQAQDDENPFEAHKAIFMDKPALDFKIIDVMTGKETALTDYKGKVTLLNFWFINCSGCQAEYPGLQTLRSKFKNQNEVAFVTVALDQPDKLKAYLQKRPLNFTTYMGDGSDIAQKMYRAIGFPMNLILDKDGIIRHIKHGGSSQSAEDIEYEMLQLLKKQ